MEHLSVEQFDLATKGSPEFNKLIGNLMDQVFTKEVMASHSVFGIKSKLPGLDAEKRDAIIGNSMWII